MRYITAQLLPYTSITIAAAVDVDIDVAAADVVAAADNCWQNVVDMVSFSFIENFTCNTRNIKQ